MDNIQKYIKEVEVSVTEILDWWMMHTPDRVHFGFYGAVNNENIPELSAHKGLVLHARILWTFSTAYIRIAPRSDYQKMADRAFDSIRNQFSDQEFGGLFWSVCADGSIADSKKQMYGQAFALYGLAAFYRAFQVPEALDMAINLFRLIEKHSLDLQYGGYLEACSRDWRPVSDMRLSDKDSNTAKSANTHLHILEAYTELYRIWPDDSLLHAIDKLLEIFDQKMISSRGELQLFMHPNWEIQPDVRSFGHEIESAWLLLHCANESGLHHWIEPFKNHSIQMAKAALDGWDVDRGGLWYEYNPQANDWDHEKHWWPQAEALLGFFNAYQLTGDQKWLDLSLKTWDYIRDQLMVTEFGEWYWGKRKSGEVILKEKAGFWKCPYHNVRACIEFIDRLKIQSKDMADPFIFATQPKN